MLFDLVAMVVVGAAVAGTVFALNHALGKFTGRRFPKWFMPAATGIAMIVYAIWNEYTWYPRTLAALPDTVEVVLPVADAAPWRPWSYFAPITNRFIAIDRGGIKSAEGRPEIVQANAIVVQRWTNARQVPMAFDCAAHKRADLIEGARITPDAGLEGTEWVDLSPDDPMLKAACQGG